MQDHDPRSSDQYFASLEPEKLTKELLFRVDQYDQYIRTSGRFSVYSKSYNLYNQGIYKDARLNRVGEQGEYTEMYVNHFRNILTHILNMTTQQRPSFDARAINSDHKSQAQTIVGNSVLEYYNRVKGMDLTSKTAVEDVLQFADAYVYQGWDFSLGQPYMPDPQNPGKVVKQGDILHKNFTPLDVIFDFTAGLLNSGRQWYVLRDFQNKWDLAQRYPELADKIIRWSNDTEMWKYMRVGPNWNYPSDYIPVFMFFHDRTDTLPNGRLFTFISDDVWLIDSPLPKFYKKLPIYRLCASEQCGSGFGYSIAYDLAPIQEAINGLYSTVITNQSTFGVQNICAPAGGAVQTEELRDGLNLISYDPKLGKPEVLQLLSTPAEIFNFLQRLETVMEVISGVNSVARGQPEESLKSGSALALVQSMAIQFISGLQQSYANMLEDLGTGIINILKECATTPRMIEITGKNNKSYMKEFTSKDISDINRVIVDVGNPIARTTAGRVNMADNLLQAGMIANPPQYLQVITTGKLDPMIEGEQAELMLIRSENEGLSDGQKQTAVAIDNHTLHIKEHRAVLASPDARLDPNIIEMTLTHIQDHLNLWRQSDPAMLQILGEPMPPQPMAPAPGTPAPLNPTNPTVSQAEKTRLPNLPKNPLSKNPALAAGGV